MTVEEIEAELFCPELRQWLLEHQPTAPSGVLTISGTLTPRQAEDLKARWLETGMAQPLVVLDENVRLTRLPPVPPRPYPTRCVPLRERK